MINIRGVSKIFGPKPASVIKRVEQGVDKETLLAETGHTIGLSHISLDISAGECFVIMGLSGSGKSTLLRHINRLVEPTTGKITIDGIEMLSLTPPELRTFRRERMAMVFQHFGLLPHQSVLDNTAFGLKMSGVKSSEYEERSRYWIKQVGLEGYESHLPYELSGGQKQRVGLARALASDADILLMDEAFSALDPLLKKEMQEQLMSLQSQLGKTIIFITHDMEEAIRIGDKIAILRDGVLNQVGTPREILLEPANRYIQSFTTDINRLRALTVGDTLTLLNQKDRDYEGYPVNQNVTLEEGLIQSIKHETNLVVRNDQSDVLGVIEQKEIASIMEGIVRCQ